MRTRDAAAAPLSPATAVSHVFNQAAHASEYLGNARQASS